MENKMQNAVKVFMEACEQPVAKGLLDGADLRTAFLYMDLVTEEYKELKEAFGDINLIEIADGAGDLIWVVFGLCNALGIDMEAVWKEITASNMSKTVEGKVIRREDGKILKPDTYFPPDIAKALGVKE